MWSDSRTSTHAEVDVASGRRTLRQRSSVSNGRNAWRPEQTYMVLFVWEVRTTTRWSSLRRTRRRPHDGYGQAHDRACWIEKARPSAARLGSARLLLDIVHQQNLPRIMSSQTAAAKAAHDAQVRLGLNLKNLRRHDPSITNIVGQAAYVGAYWNDGNGWVSRAIPFARSPPEMAAMLTSPLLVVRARRSRPTSRVPSSSSSATRLPSSASSS